MNEAQARTFLDGLAKKLPASTFPHFIPGYPYRIEWKDATELAEFANLIRDYSYDSMVQQDSAAERQRFIHHLQRQFGVPPG